MGKCAQPVKIVFGLGLFVVVFLLLLFFLLFFFFCTSGLDTGKKIFCIFLQKLDD